MQEKVKKKFKKILSQKKTSILLAILIVLTAMLLTICITALIPFIILGIISYYLYNEKSTSAPDEKTEEQTKKETTVKDVFLNSINLFCSSGVPAESLAVPPPLMNMKTYEASNGIKFFRFYFPLYAFDNLSYGTWDDVKSEIQHLIDEVSKNQIFNLPIYHDDYGHILEETVRLYDMATSDYEIVADIFLVENDASYRLYRDTKPVLEI